jgi:hypothetical protein
MLLSQGMQEANSGSRRPRPHSVAWNEEILDATRKQPIEVAAHTGFCLHEICNVCKTHGAPWIEECWAFDSFFALTSSGSEWSPASWLYALTLKAGRHCVLSVRCQLTELLHPLQMAFTRKGSFWTSFEPLWVSLSNACAQTVDGRIPFSERLPIELSILMSLSLAHACWV